jgi:hypothetical protein
MESVMSLRSITSDTDTTGTVQVRRIAWQSLWKLRPDLRPDNDNEWRCADGKSEVVWPAE